MFKKIFSIKNEGVHKVFTILGFKIKFKSFRNQVKSNINGVNNKVEEIIANINETKSLQQQLFQNVCEYQNKVNNDINEIKAFQQQAIQSLNEHKNRIIHLNPLVNWMAKNYYQSFVSEDLTEKYIKLISGLDEESVKVINRVLFRIQRFALYNQCDFEASLDEFLEIEKIRLIYSNPLHLGGDIYAFGNHVIPSYVYCATALYYNCYIDKINDMNKVLNGDIIDAGAFIGDSALVLSKYTKGKVHAFEPSSKNFEKMLKTIEINNLKNVVPVKAGLGKESCDTKINVIPDEEVVASFSNEYDNGYAEDAKIMSIDEYVEQNNIKVGLIKTDVEGFEQDLLQGALKTIKRDKPVLSISIYHTCSDFFNIKPMIESLNLGYKFKVFKPDVTDISCDVTLIAEVPAEK